VLSRDALGVDGWRPVIDTPPIWWEAMVASAASPIAAPVTVPSGIGASTLAGGHEPRGTLPSWVESLLGSAVYASQRALVGRSAPSDEQMRAVLGALVQGSGRVARSTLAAALAMPEVRVRGLAAGVRRVLNVEGFPILEEEEGTGTLTLNLDLLRKQFSLPEDA